MIEISIYPKNEEWRTVYREDGQAHRMITSKTFSKAEEVSNGWERFLQKRNYEYKKEVIT